MKKFAVKSTINRGNAIVEVVFDEMGPRTVMGCVEDMMRDLQPGEVLEVEIERPGRDGKTRIAEEWRTRFAQSDGDGR